MDDFHHIAPAKTSKIRCCAVWALVVLSQLKNASQHGNHLLQIRDLNITNVCKCLNTPPKINIAPEKWWLEDDPFLLPFGMAYFQGQTVKLPGSIHIYFGPISIFVCLKPPNLDCILSLLLPANQLGNPQNLSQKMVGMSTINHGAFRCLLRNQKKQQTKSKGSLIWDRIFHDLNDWIITFIYLSCYCEPNHCFLFRETSETNWK